MDLTNWKTTASGLAVIVVWILKLILKIDISTEVAEGITAILIGIGFFFAKDKNVTGGTVDNKERPPEGGKT